MKSNQIEIGCMNDKPGNKPARCFKVTTKVLVNGDYVNVYDSYRSMASSHEIRKYRQIYAGMSSDERQCITCDVDIPFEESAVEEVKYRCSLYHIPLPTNIVVNLRTASHRPSNDQQHYQIQWELDKPFYVKDWSRQDRYTSKVKNTYLTILGKLAEIFDGDKNYKGLWHKNAYCSDEIRRVAVTDTVARLEDFLKWYTSIKKSDKRYTKKSYGKGTGLESRNPSLSRNCYMLSKLPSKVYYYMYNTGSLPDTELAMEWARELEKDSLKINKKKSIESDYRIRATVNGVLSKCSQTYNVANIERSNIRRDLSLAIRRVKRGFKILKTKELLSKGTTKKEVARLLGVNINTVASYNNKSIEDVRNDFFSFVNIYTQNQIRGYEDVYKSVTDALPALY